MNKWDEEPDGESSGPAQWFTEVMRATLPEPSAEEAFRARCDEAAVVAHSIARLRRERQRVGFVPLPLAEYIHGLVKLASVPLGPVFSWLGVTDLTFAEPGSARGAARLAREIGMSLREALTHLRIGLAAQAGAAPVPLLVARHRSAGRRRTPLEECEEVLEQIEVGYDLDGLKRLRNLESAVGAVYE
jgi:hypothetical protein